MMHFPKTLLEFQRMFPTEESCFIVAVEVLGFTIKDGVERSRPGRVRIDPLLDYTRQQIQASFGTTSSQDPQHIALPELCA
jgi:hypothetical protein